MALMIGCKIEEVFFFFPKCVLMMCCLMECHSNPFQNAGNSALYLCFVSMIGGRDEWRILLWRDLAWGHLSPMICKRNTVQDACTATCRIKQLNAGSRYQQTIWILCLQLEKKRALIEWCYLFMHLSLLKARTTNYRGYWLNSAVAHNWFEKIKCLLLWDSISEKSTPQHTASLDTISWSKPQPLFQATLGKHLSPRSHLCAVKKRFAFTKVQSTKPGSYWLIKTPTEYKHTFHQVKVSQCKS